MYNYYLIIVFVAILLVVISMYFIWQKQLEMEISISSIRNLRSCTTNTNSNQMVNPTITTNVASTKKTKEESTFTNEGTSTHNVKAVIENSSHNLNNLDSPDIIQDIVEKELSSLNHVPLSSKIVLTTINPFGDTDDIDEKSNVVEEINSLDEVIIRNDDDEDIVNEEYENLDLIQNLLNSSRSEFTTLSVSSFASPHLT